MVQLHLGPVNLYILIARQDSKTGWSSFFGGLLFLSFLLFGLCSTTVVATVCVEIFSILYTIESKTHAHRCNDDSIRARWSPNVMRFSRGSPWLNCDVIQSFGLVWSNSSMVQDVRCNKKFINLCAYDFTIVVPKLNKSI